MWISRQLREIHKGGTMYRICTGCELELPLASFSRNLTKKSGVQSHCKDCNAKYRALNDTAIKAKKKERRIVDSEYVRSLGRAWWKKNSDKIRDRRLLSQFGINEQQYQDLLKSQNGVCAICGRPPQKKRLAVDHSHTTGVVRGLLCSPCNVSLGGFQDSLEILQRAYEYLKNSLVAIGA